MVKLKDRQLVIGDRISTQEICPWNLAYEQAMPPQTINDDQIKLKLGQLQTRSCIFASQCPLEKTTGHLFQNPSLTFRSSLFHISLFSTTIHTLCRRKIVFIIDALTKSIHTVISSFKYFIFIHFLHEYVLRLYCVPKTSFSLPLSLFLLPSPPLSFHSFSSTVLNALPSLLRKYSNQVKEM